MQLKLSFEHRDRCGDLPEVKNTESSGWPSTRGFQPRSGLEPGFGLCGASDLYRVQWTSSAQACVAQSQRLHIRW